MTTVCHAQKEDHQWLYHWGSVDTVAYPGVVASVLDFNSLPPIAYRKSEILIYMRESHASICDENGQLLY